MYQLDGSGQSTGPSGSERDDSHRTDADRAMIQTIEHLPFLTMFEITGTAMAIVRSDMTILLANERLCDLLDYPKAEIEGKVWTEYIHPDDLAAM